ncbi:MAG: LysM peptidoglycan-binding domain-containing protein [Vicinamibacteria bacterium]
MSALCLALVHAEAQEPTPGAAVAKPAASGDLQRGPATIPQHWSRYKYPESIPEGATFYIIQRGDTLWDLSGKYLGNPFLWPQIWDQNRYITDAHWIYPGDPLILPEVALVTDRAGEAGAIGGEPTEEGMPGQSTTASGDVLFPAIEEMALQCAHYVVSEPEDESLVVMGSEHGATKLGFADRDILYLNKGSNAGIKAGDVMMLHHGAYTVKHPASGKNIGRKIEPTGWIRVLLVQENSSTVVVERACIDIHTGDFAKPFEKASVPLILRRTPVDRLTPPSGKADGLVIDVAEDSMIAGSGQLVSVNLGTADGIAPGTILTVYKIMYPSVPTSRVVLGEAAVVLVREKTATARLLTTTDHIMAGDRVEVQ